jgi:hypothetical protein
MPLSDSNCPACGVGPAYEHKPGCAEYERIMSTPQTQSLEILLSELTPFDPVIGWTDHDAYFVLYDGLNDKEWVYRGPDLRAAVCEAVDAVRVLEDPVRL